MQVVHLPPAKPDQVNAERLNASKARFTWRHDGERVQKFVIERIRKRHNGEWTTHPRVFEVNGIVGILWIHLAIPAFTSIEFERKGGVAYLRCQPISVLTFGSDSQTT